MGVDVELMIYAEAETFKGGQWGREEIEVVEGVLKVLIQTFFCITVEHGEVNFQFADALYIVEFEEWVDCGVITTGIGLVDPHPRRPLVPDARTVGVIFVIAMFQVQTDG